MRANVPLNLYDLGLLVVFGFAGWQWFYSLVWLFEWTKRGADADAWWAVPAFILTMFVWLIGGVCFFAAMFITAWKPWV